MTYESILNDSAEMALPLHPFYPLGVVVPGYVANTMSATVILSIFYATCATILGVAYVLTRRAQRTLTTGETWTALWFVLCGTIHLFLEGYFAINAHQMGGRMDILGQSWKLYALSDSRYLTRDSFVTCMETLTAFLWGPLSFVCAWCIAVEHPLRHPLQSTISLGQLYGVILYYATCAFDEIVAGQAYSRPERVYYWGLYVFLNAFWVFIPAYLIYQSTRETAKAFAIVQQARGTSGFAKKRN